MKLRDLSDEQLNEMAARDNGAGYADVKALRRQAFIEHVAAMPADPRLNAWAARMADRHGPLVGMHFHGRHHTTGALEPHAGLPWLAALLVGRYGEAPYHWPDRWSEDDVKRAGEWEIGKRGFEGAFFITVEG